MPRQVLTIDEMYPYVCGGRLPDDSEPSPYSEREIYEVPSEVLERWEEAEKAFFEVQKEKMAYIRAQYPKAKK